MKKLSLLLMLALIAISCEQVGDFIDDKGHGLTFIEGEQKAIFSDKGDTKNYKFTAEMDWRASVSAEWVEVRPSSGKAGENKIQIKVEKNKTDQKRTGYVDILLSNDETYRIELEQLAAGGGDDEAVIYDSSEIPTNEIWYISTDDQVVYPVLSGADIFGAEIISNTYADGKGVMLFDGVVSKIGEYAYYSYDSPRETLLGIFMPNSIKEVGFAAFCGCPSLQYVELPDGLTTIGQQAFAWTNIETITIPESVVTVGDNPFDKCSNLKEFKGKHIADEGRCLVVDGVLKSFACGCGLTEYTTPDEAKGIGHLSFAGSQLTKLVIAPGTEALDVNIIQDSESLTSITIPGSITSFGGYALVNYCPNLREINSPFSTEDKRCLIFNSRLRAFAPAGISEYTIPDSVKMILGEVFVSCENLTDVIIPEGVENIQNLSFGGCVGLTSIVLPSTLYYLGFAPFYACSNLKEVYCKSLVPPIIEYDGWQGFDYNAPDRVIYVPMESVDAYKVAYGWADYADCIVGYDM